MFNYDPRDHYWRRNNGKAFSSRRGIEVAANDAEYAAWLAAGNAPTAYPKDVNGNECSAELDTVLRPYGLSVNPRRTSILAELNKIDADTLRPLRAVLAGSATIEDEIIVGHLEERAEELRAELATLRS